MRDVLGAIPLLGWAPQIVLGGLAVLLLAMAVPLWRRHKVWRWICVFGFLVFAVATAGVVVNTKFAYFDTLADLAGIPSYPVDQGGVDAAKSTGSHPDGLVIAITVPDTKSKFGNYTASVWLPPQYFSDTRRHFPVVYLIHGNPGDNSSWLTAGTAAASGLSAATAGAPAIVVMPQVLQDSYAGDSLCVDTKSQGNALTYITQDVISAVDSQLRTVTNAKGRTIAGNSMGGFCALNLGLQHPDIYSVLLDYSGDTVSDPDLLQGGNQALYGGSDWQQQTDANSPEKYFQKLDSSKGPAIWMDVGDKDGLVPKITQLAGQLKAKGFTVELHIRSGDHDFYTWTAAFKESLPWAVARMNG